MEGLKEYILKEDAVAAVMETDPHVFLTYNKKKEKTEIVVAQITEEVLEEINKIPAADVAPRWIPVTERLPETTDPVNITWVNRKPSGYNEHIKDKPFVATGHYCNGRWYWFSSVCEDHLNEYGDCRIDRIDSAIEVIAWMPIPKPYKEGEQNG